MKSRKTKSNTLSAPPAAEPRLSLLLPIQVSRAALAASLLHHHRPAARVPHTVPRTPTCPTSGSSGSVVTADG
ncbi:hypothetical protein GN956_G11595 [Arapaima gigas]